MVLSVFSPTKAAIYVSLLFLAACDGGATAIPKSEKATSSTALNSFERADAREAPVPQLDGKPIWTASRRYTAEETSNGPSSVMGRTSAPRPPRTSPAWPAIL